jgi:hypothetical protein
MAERERDTERERERERETGVWGREEWEGTLVGDFFPQTTLAFEGFLLTIYRITPVSQDFPSPLTLGTPVLQDCPSPLTLGT